MKIGVVIAIEKEFSAFQRALDEIPTLAEKVSGRDIYGYRYHSHDLFVIQSGAGEINAAAATQTLIVKYKVDVIFNFGVCGGLSDSMALFDTVAVESVVHYDYDTSPVDGWEKGRYPQYPSAYIPASRELIPTGMRRVVCASADRFLADKRLKKNLYLKYQAEVCDMEAAGVLLTANTAGIPALLVKVVSDSLRGGPDEYRHRAVQAADACMESLKKLMEEK